MPAPAPAPGPGPRPVPARPGWWGNITFAVGLSAILIGVTNAVKPYGGHAMAGRTRP